MTGLPKLADPRDNESQSTKGVDMWFRGVLACGLLVMAGHAVAVNKCTGADGKVVFQDAPCEGKGEKLQIMGAGQGDPNSQGAQYWQRQAEKNRRDAAVQRAIGNRQVMIGMSPQEVVAAWGQPTKINTTINAGGRSEQWVYRRAGVGAQYIYLVNGTVRSMQDSP